jgi:hypothetical protein
MQVKLQQFSAVGMWLLILWCLSPLGGQASLRLLQQRVATNSTGMPLHYMSTGPAAATFVASLNKTANARFMTMVFVSRDIMSRSEDIYSKLRIPQIEALNSTAGEGGWHKVPSTLRPEDYSSLAGLRVVGLPHDKDVRFNLGASYITATCQPFVTLPYSFSGSRLYVSRVASVMNINLARAMSRSYMPGDKVKPYSNDIKTIHLAPDSGSSLGCLKAYMGLQHPSADPTSHVAVARRLVFGALYATDNGSRKEYIHLTNCVLHKTHVEVAAHCPREEVGSSCRVEQMRISQRDKRSPSLTMLDHPWLANSLSQALPSLNPGSVNTSAWVEHFLLASSIYTSRLARQDAPQELNCHDLSQVPPEAFSERLSTLLNSFILLQLAANSGVANPTIAHYANASLPLRDVDMFAARPPPSIVADNKAFDGFVQHVADAIYRALIGGLPFVPAATTATAGVHTPVFACHFGWLAELLLAAGALLATGAAALALQLRFALLPDVLRYVASLACASLHFRTPPGGSTLDGGECARLLRYVRVRIGDIRAGGEGKDAGDEVGCEGGIGVGVGEIAFVAADSVAMRRLNSKRLYA